MVSFFPVSADMAQRMEELFTAMSVAQRQDVADQIAATDGVVDIVGGLNAMGVFDMGGTLEQNDPTMTHFMCLSLLVLMLRHRRLF